MKPLFTNPRVLLCTAYRRFPADYLDYVGEQVFFKVRCSLKRTVSPGLRFIKQNVPEVQILEYPMWDDYVKKLKEGWDVVGFSFYENEVGEVMRMASEARRQGVKELWAGNYGALDPAIPGIVDRVITGAAEDEVAQVFGYRVTEVEHPVMYWPFRLQPGSIPFFHMGFIYSQHGCPFRCSFCQTPAFTRAKPEILMETIERALAYYARIGVSDVMILDELFGINPKRADEISRLLAKYKLRWWAQSRMSLFLSHLDTWYERGLRFPLVGVEAMSQRALDTINKRQKLELVSDFVRKTGEKPGMYRMAYYMIGYEHETVHSTLEDVRRLKETGFDAHQVNVITPFPQTPLWDETDRKYGIFDRNPRNTRNYDAKHLVWNHPHISPKQMDYLLRTTIHTLNPPFDIYVKKFTRMFRQRFQRNGLKFIWHDLIKTPLRSAFTDERRQVFFPRLKDKKSKDKHRQELSTQPHP